MAAMGVLIVAGFIIYEIVLRTFFATSTFMMNEIVGYLVAAIGFLALGHAFERGDILRVSLLLQPLSRWPLARLVLEVVLVLATLAVTGFLISYFYGNVERQFTRGYTSGTMSNMPQWIPTGMMLVGLVVFWLQVLAYGLGVALRQIPPSADPQAEAGVQ
ncbi:TRAP transporter small permease subunit [Acuticoccus sp. 2012]|uniref:TRAP transporter small permease protein n=2 Tax=Acuticoccus mangrovi TaxID=2796142 RepID=A0A934MIM7_9HYPH|nr:TRAP transporter small permease subunit [Acuticoccus mangrovi]